MDDTMFATLTRAFPPEKGKTKAGQGGKKMSYISHGLITERLSAADPGWSWRVVTEHTYLDEAGRLHCAGVTVEMTVGGVTRVEAGGPRMLGTFADEIKNSYSDALKRAAMRFGVALGMWESLVDAEGDEDYDALPSTTTASAKSVVAHDNISQPDTTTPVKAPTKERPGGMTGAQNRKVWATAREKGLDSDDVHALATDAYDIEASLWELKRADAARLIDYLEETDVETLRRDADEARVVVAGGAEIGPEEARFIAYRDRIDSADVPALNKIAVELAGNGQATDEIRACYRKRQEELAKAAAAIEELPGMPVVDNTARRVRALTHI